MIPDLAGDFLPPGMHTADWDEVVDRFHWVSVVVYGKYEELLAKMAKERAEKNKKP